MAYRSFSKNIVTSSRHKKILLTDSVRRKRKYEPLGKANPPPPGREAWRSSGLSPWPVGTEVLVALGDEGRKP
jgi:hypothetical protein